MTIYKILFVSRNSMIRTTLVVEGGTNELDEVRMLQLAQDLNLTNHGVKCEGI